VLQGVRSDFALSELETVFELMGTLLLLSLVVAMGLKSVSKHPPPRPPAFNVLIIVWLLDSMGHDFECFGVPHQ
jgi:hypothetical protein